MARNKNSKSSKSQSGPDGPVTSQADEGLMTQTAIAAIDDPQAEADALDRELSGADATTDAIDLNGAIAEINSPTELTSLPAKLDGPFIATRRALHGGHVGAPTPMGVLPKAGDVVPGACPHTGCKSEGGTFLIRPDGKDGSLNHQPAEQNPEGKETWWYRVNCAQPGKDPSTGHVSILTVQRSVAYEP